MISQEQKPEISRLVERLLATPLEGVVSYGDLSIAAHVDVVQNRWLVLRALQIVNDQHGTAFATLRNIGYRRLAAAPALEHVGSKSLGRCRRSARMGSRRLGAVLRHANDLTAAQRRLALQQMSSLGMIEHLSRPRTVAALPETEPMKGDSLQGLKQALGI